MCRHSAKKQLASYEILTVCSITPQNLDFFMFLSIYITRNAWNFKVGKLEEPGEPQVCSPNIAAFALLISCWFVFSVIKRLCRQSCATSTCAYVHKVCCYTRVRGEKCSPQCWLESIIMLAGMLTPLHHSRYITNTMFAEAFKCPSLHTPFLDRFRVHEWYTAFSRIYVYNVNALGAFVHSKYRVQKYSDLGDTSCFRQKHKGTEGFKVSCALFVVTSRI